MSSRLSELVSFKELWESRKENAESAIKFYYEEITKEVNKTKEENKMKNNKELTNVELSVAQEASNFGYQAIQGIVSANEDKNNPIYIEVPTKLKMTFTREDYLQYGKDCYIQGQNDTEDRILAHIKRNFTFSDFDTSVKRTWKDQDFKDAVSNAALGLTGEAGEVADLIKKAIYHGRGFTPDGAIPDNGEIDNEDVKDELSDVLFYVSAMAQEFGFTLEEVARHNKEKLEKRYEKGFTVEESAQKKDKYSIEYKVPTTVRGGF